MRRATQHTRQLPSSWPEAAGHARTVRLLEIRSRDTPASDSFYFPELKGPRVRLENREQLLWQGEAQPSQRSDGELIWELGGAAMIAVTDRRIVYWTGVGRGRRRPFLPELTLARRAMAAARSKSMVAAGQVRFAWPCSVAVIEARGSWNKLDQVLLICDNSGLTTELRLRGVGGQEFAVWLVRLIARYRLKHLKVLGLDDEAAWALGRQFNEPAASEPLDRKSPEQNAVTVAYHMAGCVDMIVPSA